MGKTLSLEQSQLLVVAVVVGEMVLEEMVVLVVAEDTAMLVELEYLGKDMMGEIIHPLTEVQVVEELTRLE